MFKKLLGILSSLAVTSVTAASVVSCTAPQFADGQDGQRVVVVTDGGHVNDRSFNQDAYVGTTKFLKDAFNHGSKHSYVEPADSNYANLISGYKMALIKKANALVLPGFTHASVVPGTESFLQKQNIVLVDCEYDAPNVISITFNSQLAGFLAGFNTSYWATTKVNGKLQGDINNDGHIAIGTFIGSSNKVSTDNYAWGLLLGMSTYNQWATKYSPGRSLVYSANTGNKSSSASSEQIKDIKAAGTDDGNWFTGSFDLGGAIKSGIVSRLIDDKKADIMFPVAGAQVQDVINYKTKTYMIGVDVDQAASYPEAADDGRYITSAVKNIHKAVEDALYRAQSKTRKNTLNIPPGYKYENDKDKYWLGTTPDPKQDWSINYTKTDNSKYLLDTDKFTLDKLWTLENGMSAAELINKKFKDELGPDPSGYLDGNIIVDFAETLIQKYANEFSTIDK